jgi:hypothetical protein
MRQAAINRMLNKTIPVSKYTDHYFRKFRRLKEFQDFPSDLDEYERLVSILFPNLEDWEKIPYNYFHCRDLGGFLVSIHQKLNEYRNRHMIKKVVQALKKG